MISEIIYNVATNYKMFKGIQKISFVAEWSVILVGCKIWGWKKYESIVLRNLSEFWCEST
jgi:hypothetical protein